MKSFFKSLKSEIGNEISKQLSDDGSKSSSGGGGQAGDGGAAAGGHGSSGGLGGILSGLTGSKDGQGSGPGIGGILSGLGGGGGGGGPGGPGGFNISMLEDVVGLVGGGGKQAGGGGGGGVDQMLRMVQKYGGILPTSCQKYVSGILKIAEMFGHGLGDDTPRTEKNPDGSFVDGFLKTLIDGRKIFGDGGGGKTVKDLISGGGGGGRRHIPTTPSIDYGGSHPIQDYDALRSSCLSNGSLFEDDLFRPVDSSVFFSNSSRRTIYWKRPHQIVSNPQFFVDGASRFDVMQGELGDCWLLAAVANLTINDAVFRSVVPSDNSFGQGEYAGIFHFRFWQYGKWIDVVVDDYLPCNANGELLFMHSEDKNEFWSALLEKAYAKIHGSYEALKGGTTCEALVDFTGGVTELYDIHNGPTNLFQLMEKAWDRGSFMGCSIEPDPRVTEAETREGLIRGHAYSITDIKTIDIETPKIAGRIPLLRIRNPWGNEGEWRGAWSDGSQEWQFVQDEMKDDMCLTFDADGEFWMSNKDFLQYFQRVEICNLSPDSLEEDLVKSDKKKWEMSLYEGAWIYGQTAGGCRNYINTFAQNPQFVITLTDPDEDDQDDKCTLIISLMQKNRRQMRQEGLDCLTIGFALYRLDTVQEDLPTPLPTNFFKFNPSVARSPTFINLREVSCRFRLPVGTYCIVPSTFEPNEEANFIIRVFSESPANLHSYA